MTEGCGRTYILAEPLEVLVSEMALDALDSPDFGKALARRKASDSREDRQLTQRLEDDRARLQELTERYVDRTLTPAEWEAARGRLLARIEDAEQRLAQATGREALVGVTGSARRKWATLGFDPQRAVLTALFLGITVGPGRRGYNKFDPSRVQPEWRV
jgi:hypothetical protein